MYPLIIPTSSFFSVTVITPTVVSTLSLHDALPILVETDRMVFMHLAAEAYFLLMAMSIRTTGWTCCSPRAASPWLGRRRSLRRQSRARSPSAALPRQAAHRSGTQPMAVRRHQHWER